MTSEHTKQILSKKLSGTNNPMYGRQHSSDTVSKISAKCKIAARNKKPRAIWVDPEGNKYNCIADAHKHYPDISKTTIRVWCRNNKNGWQVQPYGE